MLVREFSSHATTKRAASSQQHKVRHLAIEIESRFESRSRCNPPLYRVVINQSNQFITL